MLKNIANMFLICALYTPAFWYTSNLTTKYGSIESAPTIAGIFSIVLIIMPLVVIYLLIEETQKK